MFTASTFDFGYPWWMRWGHLIPLVVFSLIALAAWRLAWRRWMVSLSAVLALWALAGFVVVHQLLAVNRPFSPPTQQFLPGGSGRVLDLGAGSGRATLMVLQNRPKTSVVALDIYSGYWGINDNTPARLRANAAAAGVEDLAIDHLRPADVARALREAARVLRPGGQILIMNPNLDGWIRVALPSLPGHGYFGREQDPNWWRAALVEAGFDVVDQGTRPGTTYHLGQKTASTAL